MYIIVIATVHVDNSIPYTDYPHVFDWRLLCCKYLVLICTFMLILSVCVVGFSESMICTINTG